MRFRGNSFPMESPDKHALDFVQVLKLFLQNLNKTNSI